jgi:hypothetical protein
VCPFCLSAEVERDESREGLAEELRIEARALGEYSMQLRRSVRRGVRYKIQTCFFELKDRRPRAGIGIQCWATLGRVNASRTSLAHLQRSRMNVYF